MHRPQKQLHAQAANIGALQTAFATVQSQKIAALDQIYSRLLRGGKASKVERKPGAGVVRGRARLVTHRRCEALKASGDVYTRQRRRFDERQLLKERISSAKEILANGFTKGGSAVIRTPLDADAVLG